MKLPTQIWLPAIFLSLLFSCQQRSAVKVSPIELSNYVDAYSSGRISKAGPIQLRLSKPFFSAGEAVPEIPNDLFSLSPKVSGSYSWEGNITILFTPNAPMESDKAYRSKVRLNKLFPNISKELSEFEFDITTREQFVSLDIQGLEKDKSGNNLQLLRGKLITADIAENQSVEKLLSIKLNGQDLDHVTWEHGQDQMTHNFVLAKISRLEDGQNLIFTVDGKGIGAEEQFEKEVYVPGLNEFKVMDVVYNGGENKYLNLQLSDPNLSDQDLKGLITISDFEGKLRFLKEGNEVNIYWTTQIAGPHIVSIDEKLKNAKGKTLTKSFEKEIIFSTPKPKVRLVGSGVIIPSADGFAFPFEAINLNAVDIEIFKIFNNNIVQYFQNNNYQGNYNLQQVGRIISQKKIELNNPANAAFQNKWTRYALDLSEMVSQDPEAIYEVRVGFQPSYTSYPCAEKATDNPNKSQVNANQFKSFWEDNYYGYNGYYSGYNWKQRENPCFAAYYNSDNFISRNVIASDLGIVGKKGNDGSVFIAINNLVNLDAVEGATVTFYDFQNQVIQTGKTDSEGQLKMQLTRAPFLVIAQHNQNRGYLKMSDNNSLSLSKFEVAGVQVEKGMKGYIYGDRGVWRPGDTLFLNFMLEETAEKLPEDLPIILNLFNPKNQLIQTTTNSKSVGGIYHFPMKTSSEDLTGNWRAEVNVGGTKFSKVVKVETIKPNRLKIEIEMDEGLTGGKMNGKLTSRWLHGAKAKNLKARVETQLDNAYLRIPKYEGYSFHDPSRSKFDKTPKVIFDKSLNESGEANLTFDVEKSNLLPGRIKQKFRTRVFENGGNFSEDNFSQNLDPFDTYVGITVPNKKNPWSYLKTGESHTFDLVSLTKELKVKSNANLTVGVYGVDWSWWWERDGSNISRFSSKKHYGAEFSKDDIRTNSKGEASFNFTPQGNGRYLVRVCDEDGGHCSGQFFYAGNPWRSAGDNKEAASMLFFAADKKEYNMGEQATISFPSSKNGRALVSIENGSKVIETKWINTTENQTEYTFELQPEMVPTAYVHVTLLQSVREKENDLPLRMYGVIPLKITDPRTKLSPEIKVAEVLKPEEKVTFEVSEKDGKPMAYTVAVVDEGLLSLTRFKTPNAADKFLAKEALGVRTWDMYDEVLSRSGGQRERLLAIGGDEGVDSGEDSNSVNRFKPVVQHFGPFYMSKNEKNKHEFTMPNYVGEVRFMLVALGDGAYGNFEKQVPVRKPLMVLSTLPRTLGLNETVSLPVNVFAMEDKVRDVSLKLKESSGLVNIINGSSQQMNFSEPGSQLGTFEIQVGGQEGVATFEVSARGGGELATETIEILIRNPNPYTSDVVFEDIKAGISMPLNYDLIGSEGSNSAYLEVSAIPSINLEKRMGYLLRYPYGCLEQTTSSAFPQLYLSEFTTLNEGQKRRATANVNRAIEKMKNFQKNNGGFSYWPNSRRYYDWSSSYAGHFLLEAKAKGFLVSEFMLNKWKKHQSQLAQQWSIRNSKNYDQTNQAYRLFTLALAGSPELGAMNRMRNYSTLNSQSKYRLAAAYALAGQPEIAKEMIKNVSVDIKPYLEMEHTFGSNIRDEAMILETLLLIEKEDDANRIALRVARALGSRKWMSTQTCAYSLMSMAKYVNKFGQSGPFNFEYTVPGNSAVQVTSDRPIYTVELEGKNPGSFNVNFKNSSSGVLFSRIVTRGKPLPGSEKAKAKNLSLDIVYTDLRGEKLDVTRLEQGTDFLAKVKINGSGATYSRYPNMALAQIFPGGWEITNSRMSEVSRDESSYQLDYQDIRDDRVYSFFEFYKSKNYPVEIQLQLSATYLGKYYLPAINCESMYNDQIYVNTAGQWVDVVQSGEL